VSISILLLLATLSTNVRTILWNRVAETDAKPSASQIDRMAVAIRRESYRTEVPYDLIIALIERESTFSPIVKSSSGCVGLMQLNPATAKVVAAKLGIRYYNLANIEHNILLGTRYLKDLYMVYLNWGAALTAYNIGPGRFRARGFVHNDYSRDVLKNRRLQHP